MFEMNRVGIKTAPPGLRVSSGPRRVLLSQEAAASAKVRWFRTQVYKFTTSLINPSLLCHFCQEK